MQTHHFGQDQTWLVVHTRDLDQLADQLDKETISYARDKNELAHTEYDWETETFTLIFNVLNQSDQASPYDTVPMTFVVKGQQFVTIYQDGNAYILDKMTRYLKKHPDMTCYKFLFASLFLISEAYFPHVEQIDQTKDEINRRLRVKTTKKDLLALSDIETGMVYLVSAANQNAFLLEQLNAQVLQQLSGTYNNILNNNLNDNMTTLTIVSILLAVLAVITGFFGMNVPLPLANRPEAWLWITGGGLLLFAGLASFLKYWMNRK